jgi:hypothetical protein
MLPTPMLGGVTGLKEGGGTFYSLSPLLCVAVYWPRLVAGTQTVSSTTWRYRSEQLCM